MFFLENSSMGGFDRATDEIRTRPRPELLSSPINKLHGNQLILQHRSRNLNASRVIRILFKIAGGGGGAAAAAAAEGHETRHRPVEHQVRGGENPHSYRITANSFSLFLLFNSVPQISSSIKHNSQGGAPSCE
jgi:hypothetical protein